MTWEDVLAHAGALPGAAAGSHYGKPAIKANGRPVVTPGHEPGSFCLHLDLESVDMLKETDPATFWQSPHYEGWPVVLVRYATDDPERVLAMIDRAHDQALAARPRRSRASR